MATKKLKTKNVKTVKAASSKTSTAKTKKAAPSAAPPLTAHRKDVAATAATADAPTVRQMENLLHKVQDLPQQGSARAAAILVLTWASGQSNTEADGLLAIIASLDRRFSTNGAAAKVTAQPTHTASVSAPETIESESSEEEEVDPFS